ncbi:MAG: PQQ-like beta-propeller repeat protein [Verrucomicrobiales bacterium]|nr:PQQ-like beta-propeller repeat protein [Verrucomicrobiales bacterium]
MKTLFSLITLSAVALFCTSTAHADWLQFRGPNGNGYIEGVQPPTQLKNSIAWSVELPGRGLASPIIVGDNVIVTCASGPKQKQLHIYSFDQQSGEIRWHRQFSATGRTMTQSKTCVAAPSPASDGKHIYALFSSNDLYCFNLDGDLIWMRSLTLDYPNASNSLGLASSPIIAGDRLIVQIENDSDSFAAGLNLVTGINEWKISRPKAANWTSPVALKSGDQIVVALQSSKGVLGVLPSTGSEVWNFAKGASTIPSSAAAGDQLYIPSNGLTAIQTAKLTGEAPKKLWNEGQQRPGTASPLIVADKIFVINGAGVLTCANRHTGKRLWRLRLKGPFSGSPVSNGTHLFIFNEQGLGQCVEIGAKEGKIISEIDLKETILGTAALSGKAIYVRSDGHLWKLAQP